MKNFPKSVTQELRKYQKLNSDLENSRDVQSVADKALGTFGGSAMGFGKDPLRETKSFLLKVVDDRNALQGFLSTNKKVGDSALSLFDVADNPDADAEKALREFRKDLKEFNTNLNKVLAYTTPAPRKFTWRNLTFLNEDTWLDRDVKILLDELEWLFDIFKRRGVTDLLQKNLGRVVLTREEGKFVVGTYFIASREIEIRHKALRAGGGRQLNKWLAEVFLHELGHHLHLNVLPTEARKFWDSGWDYVNREIDKATVIRPSDAAKIYEDLNEFNFDVSRLNKRYKGIEKLKLLGLLRHLGFVSGTTLRMDRDAKHFFDKADSDSATRAALHRSFRGTGKDIRMDPDLMEKARKANPDIDKALNSLGIPTEYGKTLVDEDFAETFVLWMVSPEKLSKVARWRMGRTLGIAGASGANIMKLTRKVAYEYSHKMMLTKGGS
jgi:hypothetical protein